MSLLKTWYFDEKAVSPVIGVMLMIVVTVILAAAVSSYSGSMESQDMAPQAAFRADASINDKYIHLEHMGGDTLDKRDIQVEIESGYPPQTGYVDSESINFTSYSNFLNPGGEMQIWFSDSDPDAGIIEFSGAEIEQSVELGEPFRVTIIDQNSGQTVYSAKITLRA
jgi:flagellin-like protein